MNFSPPMAVPFSQRIHVHHKFESQRLTENMYVLTMYTLLTGCLWTTLGLTLYVRSLLSYLWNIQDKLSLLEVYYNSMFVYPCNYLMWWKWTNIWANYEYINFVELLYNLNQRRNFQQFQEYLRYKGLYTTMKYYAWYTTLMAH